MVSEKLNVRIKFKKTGKLKFISHLDLNRTVTTALVRAKIPAEYSDGFNPRPKITFALPLPIGTESVCEFLDIKLVRTMGFEMMKLDFNAAVTEELEAEDIYEPETKLNEIGFSEYAMAFENGADIKKIEAGSPLLITKKSKQGEKTVDIRPLIKRYEYDAECKRLNILLSAEENRYVSPEHAAKELCAGGGYTIIRTNIYMRDGITVFR